MTTNPTTPAEQLAPVKTVAKFEGANGCSLHGGRRRCTCADMANVAEERETRWREGE